MVQRLIRIFFAVLLMVAVAAASCCSHSDDTPSRLDLAESLLETRPDSALAILDSIPPSGIRGREEAARYALLRSMALDKNYIDTTAFDVLQPAIDYYIGHGTPDEELRTYYYQGRIYDNRGDDDSAMMCYMRAAGLGGVTDSLVLARCLTAIASMYHKQYKAEDYVRYNIDAAEIYAGYGIGEGALDCYSRALIGKILLCDKAGADSLLSVCAGLLRKYPGEETVFFPAYVSYVVEYGSPEELKSFLDENRGKELSEDDTIDFARGYARIGDYAQALAILSEMEQRGEVTDSLKYAAARSAILERQGNFEEALRAYKVYAELSDRDYTSLMNHKMLFSDEFHRLEIENIEAVQSGKRIFWIAVSGVMGILLLSCWLYYRYCLARSERIIAEKDKERLETERRQRQLEADNLRYEKAMLEEERDRLRELLEKHDEVAAPVLAVMKLRHEMLNSILARDLTQNDDYAKPYQRWIESMRSDKEEFMNSTRIAFTASHPEFIHHLENRGLSTDEINYLCLYAIGLRGKDVGEYMQLKRHYNISSELRRKLGLGEHDANLGRYIRRLMDEL